MIQFLREWWAMQKASKWFDKNPAAQARFEAVSYTHLTLPTSDLV